MVTQFDPANEYTAQDAVLVLEDGQVYVGEPFGATGSTCAEIVFNTAMTGYQETLTDPSYDRQIVVQTFPHIGDTGVNDVDLESSRIWVAGYVVRDPSMVVSNWRAAGSLDDDLMANHIVGISHIDTRKLVRQPALGRCDACGNLLGSGACRFQRRAARFPTCSKRCNEPRR